MILFKKRKQVKHSIYILVSFRKFYFNFFAIFFSLTHKYTYTWEEFVFQSIFLHFCFTFQDRKIRSKRECKISFSLWLCFGASCLGELGSVRTDDILSTPQLSLFHCARRWFLFPFLYITTAFVYTFFF